MSYLLLAQGIQDRSQFVYGWESVAVYGGGIGTIKIVEQPVNVTGVFLILPFSNYSIDGSYNLAYDYSEQALSWGDGSATTISEDNLYTLNDSSGKIIYAAVDFSALPGSDQTDNGLEVSTSTAIQGLDDTVGQTTISFAQVDSYYFARISGAPGYRFTMYISQDLLEWRRIFLLSDDYKDRWPGKNIIYFDGKYYMGSTGVHAQMWESSDLFYWKLNKDFYDDISSEYNGCHELAVFGEELYVGIRFAGSTVEGEIWKTADGSSWSKVVDQFDTSYNTGPEQLFTWGGYLYALTQNSTNGAQVWRSSDGINFLKVFNAPVATTGLYYTIHNNVLYIASYDNGSSETKIWKTENGSDFTLIMSDGFGDSSNNLGIGAILSGDNFLYITTRNQTVGSQVYRSANGGDSWSQINVNGYGDGSTVVGTRSAIYKDGYFYSSLFYSGTDPSEILRYGIITKQILSIYDGLLKQIQSGDKSTEESYAAIAKSIGSRADSLARASYESYGKRGESLAKKAESQGTLDNSIADHAESEAKRGLSTARHSDSAAERAASLGRRIVIRDLSPQLGGDLDLNGFNLLVTQLPGGVSSLAKSGFVITLTVGENLTFGEVVYFKSDGKVWKAKGDNISTCPVIGVCVVLDGIAADATGSILLRGVIRNEGWSWTSGQILYLSSATAGALSASAPSTVNHVMQVLGVALFPGRIYFNPQLYYATVQP
jgi:hypothetical protein